MRITWLAHAAFLIESRGLRILTDPYRPETLGLDPIPDQADLVIRSSSNDRAHCWIDELAGDPAVVTATEIPAKGTQAFGVRFFGIPSQESIDKEDSRPNAMYRFELEGLVLAHFGDVGNRLRPEQLDRLNTGKGIDVAFVPAGGPPTIPLSDLRDALDVLKPRCVIPMHYKMPGNRIRMLPVEEFLQIMRPCAVERRTASSFELDRKSLPAEMRITVVAPRMARIEAGAASRVGSGCQPAGGLLE